MYPKVDFPKKVTEKWLRRAFAPLEDYLERQHPAEKNQIMAYMTFMSNENQEFYYRNYRTKGAIILDQAGALVKCDKYALQYEFQEPEAIPVNRPRREERFVHPNVTRWMEGNLNRRQDKKYGEDISIFLQEYWGPMVNFALDDLKTGYPLRRRSPRYCLYAYPTEFRSLVAIQFVGDEIVERRCSYAEYRTFMQRERELTCRGYHVITICREALDRDADQFRFYLSKATELADPRLDTPYVLTAAGRQAMEELEREEKDRQERKIER